MSTLHDYNYVLSKSERFLEFNSAPLDVTYVPREKVPPSKILFYKACSFYFPCIVLIFVSVHLGDIQ